MVNNKELSKHFIKTVHAQLLQSCPTLCNPMDQGLPGSSVPKILQARILKWVAIPCSRGSSQLRDWTQVFHTAGGFFTVWATRETHIQIDPIYYNLKNRDIALPTKVYLVKAMVFPVVMYGCESLTIKKAECQRIDAFEVCGVGEDSWESLGLQGYQTNQF